ncbi:MAG: M24 family metallopeptidase [Planctomycetaceae bacterium]
MTGQFAEDPRPKRLLVQDKVRLLDVEEKHNRVRALLESVGVDALLLQDAANIAWFTAGADLNRLASDSCHTSVFITAEARLFATNAVDSAQIFEREAFGLGFQLKQREWFQPHRELIRDLCRGRKVASDVAFPETKCVCDEIREIRVPLTPLEVDRMRRLSLVATHAVEAAAHNLCVGTTEAKVAGEVAHRLVKRTVTPVRIQVCADGRNDRYRHWTFGEDRIEKYASISCVARRWGLRVGVSRTACLGDVPEEIWDAHQKAVLMLATGLFFSRAGRTLDEVWQKVRRIYEKFGLPSEWQKADQAELVGFSLCEQQLLPGSTYEIPAAVAMHWHPSVGPAMTGDTMLIEKSSVRRLTISDSWPELTVFVKGHPVPCPGLLKVRSDSMPVATDDSTSSAISPLLDASGVTEESLPPMDSIWELDAQSDQLVFEEEDSPYPEESVLE